MELSATIKKLGYGKVAGVITLAGSIVGIASGVIPLVQERNNVDGTWTLKTQTEKTTETKFKDMEVTYTVNFTHEGAHVKGEGHKMGEKLAGEPYTPYEGAAHTSIEIEGNLDVDCDSLDAIFTEEGMKRHTSGHFELKRQGKSWAGTFSSEAAQSSGTVLLSRSSE